MVCLTAFNACGTDSLCVPVAIECDLPTGDFSVQQAGDSTHFTAAAMDYDSLGWDFGNGLLRDVPAPSVELGDGPHWVCLTLFSSCGDTTICDSLLGMPGLGEADLGPRSILRTSEGFQFT